MHMHIREPILKIIAKYYITERQEFKQTNALIMYKKFMTVIGHKKRNKTVSI